MNTSTDTIKYKTPWTYDKATGFVFNCQGILIMAFPSSDDDLAEFVVNSANTQAEGRE